MSFATESGIWQRLEKVVYDRSMRGEFVRGTFDSVTGCRLRRWAILVAFAFLAAACGQEQDLADSPATPEGAQVDSDEVEALDGVDETETPDVQDSQGEGEPASDEDSGVELPPFPEPFEAVALPGGTNTLPALGGVQFDLPAPSRVLVDTNCILIFEPGAAELGPREVHTYIGEFGVTRSGSEFTPISTIEQWREVVELELGEAVEPTGETLEVLGETLSGFRFTDSPFLGEAEGEPELFNCGTPAAPAGLEAFPLGFEEWFVGETGDALFFVVSGGPTQEIANQNHAFRDQFLASLVSVDPPEPIAPEVAADPAAPPTRFEPEAPDLGDQVRTVTYPALGGVRFDTDLAHDVYAYGDGVFIDPAGIGGSVTSDLAVLALLTQFPDTSPVATVDDVLSAFGSVPELSVQPNGQLIELFDRELVGYSVDLSSAPEFLQVIPDPALRLLDTTRRGALPFSAITPQRSQIYLAETPAGVLYASFDVNPYALDPPALDAFATLLETVELTGPGFDAPLPDATTFGGVQPPPVPAEIVEDGPPGLFVAFTTTPSGRNQIHNFGIPISADVSGWFIQPNQPGAVVFVGGGISRGPGDRGVVMLAGLEPQITPQAGGPSIAGEPVDLSDIEAFLANPPDNLDVSNVVETEVGGLEAFRFDVRVADGATCAQDDPCEYAFETAWNWAATVSINAENDHRIWWMPDHPAGPAMIHVTDIDPEFIEIGTRFVESIETVG